MTDQLKSQQKAVKKNKEIVAELDKLAGSDLKILQAGVGELNKELDKLKEEWNEYKKPIADEIQQEK